MKNKKEFALCLYGDDEYGLFFADEKGRHRDKLLAVIKTEEMAHYILNKLNKQERK